MGQYDRKKQSQPKHGKPSSSGASKAPPPLSRGVPGWKGPGYVHKKTSTANSTAPKAPEPTKLEHILPVELEQHILDVFRNTFPVSNDFEALKLTLQKINDALLRREFDTALGNENFLEAYAIRWSPSRSLAYAQLLAWICAELAEDTYIQHLVSGKSDKLAARVVCFGGGPAEIIAFSALLRSLQPSEAAGRPPIPAADVSDSLEAISISAPKQADSLLHLKLFDTADWASVLSKLDQGLTTPPPLSRYASAAARARNASFLLPGALEHAFTRADVLGYSTNDLCTAIGTAPALLTFMFTLNELYMASISRTTAFLQRITEATPRGSLLLVVDTPGAQAETSASITEEGENKRTYPISRLLDYALRSSSMKRPNEEDNDEEKPGPAWEKVMEKASMSYRLEQDLKYPVSLENTKFQVHLFKRI